MARVCYLLAALGLWMPSGLSALAHVTHMSYYGFAMPCIPYVAAPCQGSFVPSHEVGPVHFFS